MPPWSRRNRPSLTAAAGNVVPGAAPASPGALIARNEKWQEKILALTSSVPEPSGASAVIRSTLDKCKLVIEADITEGERQEIQRQIDGFQTGRAGQLIWLVGECFPSWEEDEDGSVNWTTYSPVELKLDSNKIAKVSGLNNQDYVLTNPWYRTWQPDIAYHLKSWSAHKSLVDVLESMYFHQLAETTVATSRLAGAGILFIPTDLPNLPLRDGRPEEGSQQELQEVLSNTMMQSITERDSSGAVVPLVMFGEEASQKPEHVLLERPDDAHAYTERMNGMAQRYARGVELPIESTMGMGPANHWTAWIIREDKWLEYVKPIGDLLADSLTRNRLKPILRQLGKDKEVVRKAKILIDGRELITKSDLTEPAIKLAQIGGLISDEAILRATGFDPAKDKFDANADNGPNSKKDGGGTRLEALPAQFRDNKPV